MDDKTKYKAIGLLQAEHTPQQVADELNCSYSAVVSLRKKLAEATLNNNIGSLLNKPGETLINVAAERLGGDVAELTDGITGLQALDVQLQAGATLILDRLNAMIPVVESSGELANCTDILCDLQTAFFGKGTQVNVQNNIAGDSSSPLYGQFLSDTPGGQ